MWKLGGLVRSSNGLMMFAYIRLDMLLLEAIISRKLER